MIRPRERQWARKILHMAGIHQIVTRAEAYDPHRSPPLSRLRVLRALNGISAAELAHQIVRRAAA
jgi:hypothetical protein